MRSKAGGFILNTQNTMPHAAEKVGRRELLRSGAWAVPVIAVAIAAPLAAATGGETGKDGLRFTHASGYPQFGNGWGTPGQFAFDLGVIDEWNADPAAITVTLYHENSGASFVVVSGYALAPGGTWSASGVSWTVPGWVSGANNFVAVVQAPGFKTEKKPFTITVQ